MLLRLFLLVLVIVALWWMLPGDPGGALRPYRESLARVERVAVPELGARLERWRMITARGDTLTALWRAAVADSASRPWTVVLLGGLAAGERAALLVPEHARANLLAVDWPWRESRRMAWWRVALKLGDVRRAVLRSPAVLALGVEAVANEPEVDRERVALLGVSLGVPPAIAATRLTERPAALVLLHGAADLSAQLEAGLVREGTPRWCAAPLAALGARLVQPLEPAGHAAVARARPVLIVNAAKDPLLPAHAVTRLHALFPAAEVRWREGIHLVPDRRAAIAGLTDEVAVWLAALRPSS